MALNNLVFNSISYLQKNDCTRSTKCAPSYANIFMGWFEQKFIFPLLANGTKTEFDNFLKKINECYPSIIFEYEMSKTKVDNKLQTKVYVKPTDRQSYLHSKPEHPNSTKNRIAYSHSFDKIWYDRKDLHNNCKRLLNKEGLQ